MLLQVRMNEDMNGEFQQCYATIPAFILKGHRFQNSGASRLATGLVGRGVVIDSAKLDNK